MKRLRALWQSTFGDADRRVRLGRLLGLAFITAGFIAIGKAWDGAANLTRVDSQFPYLLSGGFMGLGLIVTGAVLLLVTTVRAERGELTAKSDEMIRLLGRNLSRLQLSTDGAAARGEQVLAGSSTFHRSDYMILQGKENLAPLTVQQAAAEGLTPCRVCRPPEPAAEQLATRGSGTPAP